MNTLQRGTITLLKSAITEQSLPLPEGFDLQAAYPRLKRHHMSTLLYSGAVNCGVERTLPVMQTLFHNYCKLLLISEGQMRAVESIFAAFEDAGIDYMPLKGCVMKSRYPKPELRIMGDADILIRTEEYDRIVPLMEALGFTAKYESDHELVWTSDALFLELHKRLIPSYNRDFHAYFGDSWALAKCREGHHCSMTAEDEMVYLFTHFAKHFRDGGIGCRHVVDLWVYRRNAAHMDEDYVRRELEKLGLGKFYALMMQMLAVWFEDAPEDEMSDLLTELVFDSGSFGTLADKIRSRVIRERKHTPAGLSSRMVYVWHTFFQSVDVLKGKYTVLQKAPWLLPLVWIYRPFYKLLFERHSLQDKRRELNVLEDEGVDARSLLLREIGLDYNF